jgi:hypothetical protein
MVVAPAPAAQWKDDDSKIAHVCNADFPIVLLAVSLRRCQTLGIVHTVHFGERASIARSPEINQN